MKTQVIEKKVSFWSTGLAMFAMFFGAGNIVFPMALGQVVLDKHLFAVCGMILTAVCVPLAGVMSMLLFDGDYNKFFGRVGKIPGFMLTLLILGLIGPFAGIPRCVTISYATLQAFGFGSLPGMNLPVFGLISCIIIFLFTCRPTRVLDLIAYVLTPLLLVSLVVIVFKGAFMMPSIGISEYTTWQAFSDGLIGGYNTMDLLAAFFFSSVVLICLRKGDGHTLPMRENKRLLSIAFYGSLIAAALLGLVYVCFTYLSAGYSDVLSDVPGHELLGSMAHSVLGPYAGLIAGVAVSFACLTTEIALTTVFAEFLQLTLFRKKISYRSALIATLLITFGVSTLHFDGIAAFVAPLVQICYPALIVLTVLNILHKIYGFKPVKLIVALAFLAALFAYLI